VPKAAEVWLLYKRLCKKKFIILEYTCAVWDPFTTNHIQSVEKVQSRAERWVLKRHRQTSCVDDKLQTLDWPSLQERRREA